MLEFLRSDSNPAGEIVAVVLVAVPFLLAVYGMRRGYRNRRRLDDARLPPVPVTQPPARPPDGEALYTGTTYGGSRGRRIAAGGLFDRGRCTYWILDEGLAFQRGPGPVVLAARIREVGLAGAHAGRVLAPGRIAVVRWMLGDQVVDSGFGFGDQARAATFAAAVANSAGLPARGTDGTVREEPDARA